MQCGNCGQYFSPEPKHVIFSIFDRYHLEVRYPEIADRILTRLQPLFFHLIEDIANGQDIQEYREFRFYIHEHDMDFKCPRCGATNKSDFVLSLPDQFFLFIEAYIDFEIDNILIKTLGMPAQDLGIDTLDINQIQSFLDEFPPEHENLRTLIPMLFMTKMLLPTLGGRGSGPEILQWIINQVIAGVIGAVVALVITGGWNGIVRRLQGLRVRDKIKKKIQDNATYWNDVSFEDLSKFIVIPKNFSRSKEELIEKIIESKVDSYKQELIEKLRNKDRTT